MEFEQLKAAAERGIRTVHECAPGWIETHSLRLEGDEAVLTRAWEIDDGDMNGEAGECVARVRATDLEAVLQQAARDRSAEATLTSQNRLTRTARYSESRTGGQSETVGPDHGEVRMALRCPDQGPLDVTIHPSAPRGLPAQRVSPSGVQGSEHA